MVAGTITSPYQREPSRPTGSSRPTRADWNQSTAGERARAGPGSGPRLSPMRSATGWCSGRAASSEAAGRLFTTTDAPAAPSPAVCQMPRWPSRWAGPDQDRPSVPSPAAMANRPHQEREVEVVRRARPPAPSVRRRRVARATTARPTDDRRGDVGREHDHRSDHGDEHPSAAGPTRDGVGVGGSALRSLGDPTAVEERRPRRPPPRPPRPPRPATTRAAKAPPASVGLLQHDQVGEVGAGEQQGRAVRHEHDEH